MTTLENIYSKAINNEFNISITGDIGSGKSTISKLLAEKLNMEIIDSGQLYRKFAEEKNLNVLEQNKSDDHSIDVKIDTYIEEVGKTKTNVLFVSRLAWYFVPNSIKIYLKVNPILAAERIAKDVRIGEEHKSAEETLEYNYNRKQLELDRYKQMYSIDDPSGYSNADIICDIGYNSIEEVVDVLYNAIIHRDFGYYVDPKVLLPTQGIRDYNVGCFEKYMEEYKCLNEVDAILNYYKDCTYIKDGHHRIAACIKLGKKFIKVPSPIKSYRIEDITTPYDYEDFVGIKDNKSYILHCSYNK